MDRVREMEVFVRIVDCGSLTRAAEALDVSLPTVVRLLAGLEKRLGARLLQRTTRRAALTSEGAEFYERSRRILADIEEAEAGSNAAAPRGLLRVTAPALLGRMLVQPLILEFLESHPGITVDLILLDRTADLVSERLDVGVRIGHLADSSLVAHRVGDVRVVLCAAPQYVARHGLPARPQDLRNHRCLRFSGFAGPVEWNFIVGGKKVKVPVFGPLLANQNAALIDACLQGAGIGRFLSYQVATLIASGRLVPVLTRFPEPQRPVSIVMPSTRLLPARTRRLVDWLRAQLPSRLTAAIAGRSRAQPWRESTPAG